MTSPAVFIDLPNFYNELIRTKLAAPEFLKDYFLNWLDYDLLANRLTNSVPSIWVFYSGKKLGISESRIDGRGLNDYVERINHLSGVTARDVNIPGEQREWATNRCDNCGAETTTEWKSEKGIDASLTVHLFDTMDAWDTAYLLSGDADFVPVVASLRRRGKIVIGAGSPKASPALVRECYSYIDLIDAFLREDVALYALFKADGVLAQWLNSVKPEPTLEPENLKIKIGWSEHGTSIYNNIFISVVGSCDVNGLGIEFSKYLNNPQFQFRENININMQEKGFSFFVNSMSLTGLKRRFGNFIGSVRGLYSEKGPYGYGTGSGCTIEYQYHVDEGRYEPIAKVAGIT